MRAFPESDFLLMASTRSQRVRYGGANPMETSDRRLPRCPMRLLFTSIRSDPGSLLPQQPRSAQILTADRGSRGIRDQPRNPPKYTEKRIRINFPFPCPSRGRAHARRVGSPAEGGVVPWLPVCDDLSCLGNIWGELIRLAWPQKAAKMHLNPRRPEIRPDATGLS